MPVPEGTPCGELVSFLALAHGIIGDFADSIKWRKDIPEETAEFTHDKVDESRKYLYNEELCRLLIEQGCDSEYFRHNLCDEEIMNRPVPEEPVTADEAFMAVMGERQ